MAKEESIMRNCAVCKELFAMTFCRKCYGCEQIVCLVCRVHNNFTCTNCGGYFVSIP